MGRESGQEPHGTFVTSYVILPQTRAVVSWKRQRQVINESRPQTASCSTPLSKAREETDATASITDGGESLMPGTWDGQEGKRANARHSVQLHATFRNGRPSQSTRNCGASRERATLVSSLFGANDPRPASCCVSIPRHCSVLRASAS